MSGLRGETCIKGMKALCELCLAAFDENDAEKNKNNYALFNVVAEALEELWGHDYNG